MLGYIYDPDGINEEKLEYIKELKNIKRGRTSAAYWANKVKW